MAESLDVELLENLRARLLQEFPFHIRTCLATLDDAQIWWRPHEEANAVANLVLHLAGSNRHYHGHVIAGEPDVRDRDAEFAARSGLSKADVLGRWDEVAALVERVLRSVTAGRLAEVTPRGGRESSVARTLLHVTHHNAGHVAQIIWITKMLRPGAIRELARTSPPPSAA
jgi:uncharacterized damage-inducible protein DinB